MLYNFNGRNIRINDDEIENISQTLELTKEEAIQIWLDDNDYTVNEEQEALDNKAKAVKINHYAKAIDEKPKSTKPRNIKEDYEKIAIIADLAKYLADKEEYDNIVIENKSKLITFSVGDNHYKLDLIKSRPKKA